MLQTAESPLPGELAGRAVFSILTSGINFLMWSSCLKTTWSFEYLQVVSSNFCWNLDALNLYAMVPQETAVPQLSSLAKPVQLKEAAQISTQLRFQSCLCLPDLQPGCNGIRQQRHRKLMNILEVNTAVIFCRPSSELQSLLPACHFLFSKRLGNLWFP